MEGYSQISGKNEQITKLPVYLPFGLKTHRKQKNKKIPLRSFEYWIVVSFYIFDNHHNSFPIYKTYYVPVNME